jgi:hypothetical protein
VAAAPADPGPPQPPASQGAGLGELLNSGEVRGATEDKVPSAWESQAPEGSRGPVAISDADRADIARVLCEGSAREARCRKCPSYTDFAGQPLEWRVGPLYPGHFSGPGQTEALVELRGGCETGARDSHTNGGHALVRRTPEGWQQIHDQGGALGECTAVLSGAGRSRLVCRLKSGHMGLYPEAFYLLGFDTKGGEVDEQQGGFLTIFHHGPTGRADEEPAADLEVIQHALRGKAKYEAGDDGALGFEATVRVRAPCARGDAGCQKQPPPPWEARLRYRLEGGAFTLAPESRAAYDRLLPLNHE